MWAPLKKIKKVKEITERERETIYRNSFSLYVCLVFLCPCTIHILYIHININISNREREREVYMYISKSVDSRGGMQIDGGEEKKNKET